MSKGRFILPAGDEKLMVNSKKQYFYGLFMILIKKGRFILPAGGEKLMVKSKSL